MMAFLAGSNANKMRTTVVPLDAGCSSFMLPYFDPSVDERMSERGTICLEDFERCKDMGNGFIVEAVKPVFDETVIDVPHSDSFLNP